LQCVGEYMTIVYNDGMIPELDVLCEALYEQFDTSL